MNYLAVMICPFIMDMFRHLFHTHSDRFPFFFNAALVFALAPVTWFRRGNFTSDSTNRITKTDRRSCE